MSSLNEETLDALQEVLNAAVEDQGYYMSAGDPEHDYGDEWPEVARTRAKRYRILAEFLTRVGGWGGLVDQMNGIANSLEASANEFRNPAVGN